MSLSLNDKRKGWRAKQEFVVGVRANTNLKIAYTIDISRGGVKIGSPQPLFPVGSPVDLVIEKRGEKYPFTGRVVRDDGNYYIDRLGRSAKALFIRIEDALFSNFVRDNYFV